MNKFMAIGRTTKEIEVRVTKDDVAVADFTLAVPRIAQEETDFIRCTVFGKTAEIMEQYVTKGMRIGIEGRVQTGSYENKDGNTVYTWTVVVERFDFCDSKKEESAKEAGYKKYQKGGKR